MFATTDLIKGWDVFETLNCQFYCSLAWLLVVPVGSYEGVFPFLNNRASCTVGRNKKDKIPNYFSPWVLHVFSQLWPKIPYIVLPELYANIILTQFISISIIFSTNLRSTTWNSLWTPISPNVPQSCFHWFFDDLNSSRRIFTSLHDDEAAAHPHHHPLGYHHVSLLSLPAGPQHWQTSACQ